MEYTVERRGILPESPQLRLLILVVLGLMAAVSLFVACKEAVSSGTDFQWSGAHLLANHIDPWHDWIIGDPDHLVILGQQPNYLAEFFLLLNPLGRMPFFEALKFWCVLNLLFTAGTLALLRRMFHLDRDHTLLVTFLMLSATPFRITMANGQHGILIMLLLGLTFYCHNRWLKGLSLGVSFGKYSFSPLMVFILLVRKRLDVVLIALIPPFIGLLIAQHMLGGTPLLVLATEPMATAKLAMGPGHGDIMTPLEIFMRNHGFSASQVYSIPAMVGLLAAVVAAIWIGRNKRLDERMQFAVGLTLTLFCFKHVLYDFVVLIVPVAAAAMAPKSRARTLVMLCMAFFFYLTTVINHFFPERVYAPEVILYSIVLLTMGIAASRLYPGPEPEPNL